MIGHSLSIKNSSHLIGELGLNYLGHWTLAVCQKILSPMLSQQNPSQLLGPLDTLAIKTSQLQSYFLNVSNRITIANLNFQ
jgi:hypothetical protein